MVDLYSNTLSNDLNKYGFTFKNITDLCGPILLVKIPQARVCWEIERLNLSHQSGCIFTLPSMMVDGCRYVCYTSMSEKDIYQKINLSYFL